MRRFPAWMLDLIGLTAAAYLVACGVTELLGGALAPLDGERPGPRAARLGPHPHLDDVTLASAFGWRAPRPPPAPPLRARLQGTVVGREPGVSWALLSDASGAHLCMPGDALGDAVVVDIEPNLVRVRTPGGEQVVALGGSQDPVPLARPPADLSRWLTGARAVPAFEGGAAIGLRMVDVQPGSPYARAGFQSGDVVERIAGYPATSADALASHAAELLARGAADVQVRRAGQPVLIHVDLRD